MNRLKVWTVVGLSFIPSYFGWIYFAKEEYALAALWSIMGYLMLYVAKKQSDMG